MNFAQECYLKILEAAEVRVRPYMRESGPVRGHTRHLNVYVKRSDIELVKGWGNEKWWAHKTSRETMPGEVLTKFQLPLLMWHVSTNINAVLQSGVLKWMGSMKTGGLGGGESKAHRGVSLTYSRDDAIMIQRELIRMGEIARTDAPFASLMMRYAKEDTQYYKLGFTEAARTAIEQFQSQERGTKGMTGELTKRGRWKNVHEQNAFDSFNWYLGRRETLGGPENPVFFGQVGDFKRLRPENVGIFAVRRSDIPNEALIMKHPIPSGALHEVRVYSEVPVHGKLTIRRSVYKHNPLRLTAQR
jgi:hypothetical protein